MKNDTADSEKRLEEILVLEKHRKEKELLEESKRSGEILLRKILDRDIYMMQKPEVSVISDAFKDCAEYIKGWITFYEYE